MGLSAVHVPKEWTLNLSGARVPGSNLSHTNLSGADLRRADFTNADFRGANMDGTRLDGTILRGADLSGVCNLTREQVEKAIIDDTTILPADLKPNRRPLRPV